VASFRLGRFGVTRDDSDSEQERDQYHDPESPIQQDNNEEYTSLDPEVDEATQQLIDSNIGVSQELIGPSISFAPGELTEENNLPYQQPNPPHRVPSPIRPPPVVAFPMATPSDKEYGRRPGEINDRKEYKRFMRELTTFLSSNTAKYDTDAKKIALVQSLCTGGAPEVWAQGKFEMAFEQQIDGIIPDAAWGTFAAYLANFITSFKDPNDSRTAQNELAILYPRKGQSMEEFFQIFDQLAQRAGHGTNDKLCIELLEAKVPSSLIEQVYKDEPPTVYDQYKASVIRYDNLRRRFEAVKQVTRAVYHHTHPSTATQSHTSHQAKPAAQAQIPATKSNTGVTYGGRGQPMEIDRNKAKAEGNCFRCGKPGHVAKNCPHWERGNTIRAMFRDCDEEERTDLLEDFLGV